MMQKTEEKNNSVQPAVAPAYQTPRLTVYGAIRELTAGGLGSTTEAAAGNKSINNRL